MLLEFTIAVGWAQIVALLVGLQRLGELALSRYNGRRLLAEGATEIGAGHYRAIVWLQVIWLLAIILFVSPFEPIRWPLLALYLLLQLGRLWVIATLGRYWTTRLYHLPGRPLVKRGPYRWLKHPNYWVLVLEVFLLPLVFGAWWLACFFGLLQLWLILWRLRTEEPALAERRRL